MKKMILSLGLLLAIAAPAWGFMEGGCGAGECADCHNLTTAEAQQLLGNGIDKVLKVEQAELPGLWAVEVEKDQRKFPIYVDYSKAYVVSGNIIRLKDKKNITQQRAARLNTVDVDKIPLDDALLMGRRDASTKVIVFTDPKCPYCKKLHAELKKVVAADPDIAFLIKLFPLPMHPEAYDIAKSIVCNDSLDLLDAAFAGKPVPPPICKTKVVDENLALARGLGIRSTPTLILPGGQVLPGYRQAADLLALLDSDKSLPAGPVAQKP
jgi:thiol:disulfide interchange protein DsbC